MSKSTEQSTIPYSAEAEEATIGAVLTNPDLYWLIREYLTVKDFFILSSQYIWRAIERIVERGDETFDYLTVSNELQAVGYLDKIGGIGHLLKLISAPVSSAHGEIYARLVQRDSQRRKLLDASEQIKAAAFDKELPIERVMVEAEAAVQRVTSEAMNHSDVTVGEAISSVYDEIQSRIGNQQLFFLPTGYRVIDQFTSGLERGCVHVIAGKPGMGKTSLCIGIAVNGSRLKVHTGFISNEMNVSRLTMRIAAMETGINLQALKRGEITEDEISRFTEAMARFQETPLYLDYIPETTIAQVHAKILRWQRRYGLDVVFIDGLWRMQAPEFTGDKSSRNNINGYLTNHLARIAKETNVAVVITHQLTKEIDKRSDKRPNKGDLEYGGQIDQNADVICLIYRDEVYDPATMHPGAAELIFDKNRDAPTGTITLYFDKRTTRFMDATPVNVNLSSKASHPIVINGEEHELD